MAGGDGSVRGQGQGATQGSGGATLTTSKNPDGSVWMPRAQTGGEPYIGAGDLYSAGVSDPNSGYFNEPLSLADALDELNTGTGILTSENRKRLDEIAKAIDYRKTGSGLWEDATRASRRLSKKGVNKTPFQIINEMAAEAVGSGSGSGSTQGGGRGGSAPNMPRVSQTPDEDIIRMANDQAMSLVGRELSKKELSAILKDVRGLEAENPQEQRVVGGRIVYSGGVSSATLQDLVQNRAAEIATKGLDAAAPLEAGAAKTADELRNWSRDNGVGLSDAALSKYTQRILRGETNVDDVKSELRRTYLVGAFPAWSDKIAAGEDPSTLFSPYVTKAQKLLERNDIDLNDPLVQRMTQYVDPAGKPAVMPLYEADKLARQDDRWQYTNNAAETYAKAATQLLQMFGLR